MPTPPYHISFWGLLKLKPVFRSQLVIFFLLVCVSTKGLGADCSAPADGAEVVSNGYKLEFHFVPTPHFLLSFLLPSCVFP